MILKKLEDRVIEIVAQKKKVKAADLKGAGIISIIVEAIMALFTGCIKKGETPKSISETANTNAFVTRVRARQTLRSAGVLRHEDAGIIEDTIVEVVKGIKEEDAVAFKEECDFVM